MTYCHLNHWPNTSLQPFRSLNNHTIKYIVYMNKQINMYILIYSCCLLSLSPEVGWTPVECSGNKDPSPSCGGERCPPGSAVEEPWSHQHGLLHGGHDGVRMIHRGLGPAGLSLQGGNRELGIGAGGRLSLVKIIVESFSPWSADPLSAECFCAERKGEAGLSSPVSLTGGEGTFSVKEDFHQYCLLLYTVFCWTPD